MGSQPDKFFLGRQPILDRKQEIIGFELLFRSAEFNYAVYDNSSHAVASVISTVLSAFGIEEVLGGKLGFINIHRGLLLSEVLELIPAQQTVLELLEDIPLDQQVIERCRELRKLGFRIALDDHEYSAENEELYGIVNIVKIDIRKTGIEDLPAIMEKLRRTQVMVLAEKVEKVEQFEACFRMGFDLFQGYFFERPTVLNKKHIDASRMVMLKLLQQLTVDASIAEIEQTFKANPDLSYNLLRLVNSVGVGMREKIKTLKHAIVMLGNKQLRRWIQLSLFAGNDARGMNHPLLEMAAVRGRLMEILVNQKSRQDELADAAFMTGILSLLDVLFEISMSDIIEHLNLSDEISDALISRQGQLGLLLSLAEKSETTDFEGIIPLLIQCNVTLDQLLTAQLESFNWRIIFMSP